MSSIILSSLTAAFAVIAAGAALPQPAAAAKAEQEVVGRDTRGVAATPATETLRGVIDSVDQGHDTLKVRLSSDTTEEFKVLDGLIFNAVRYGDPVELTVERIDGERTIIGLRKE
jgi:Cu/Ag efflux protein CusF